MSKTPSVSTKAKGLRSGTRGANILPVINGKDIPLAPIHFLTRREFEKRKIPYQTAMQRVLHRLENLELSKYVGTYYPEDVGVLREGYDAKKIGNCIVKKGWDFIVSLISSRSVKSFYSKEKWWRNVADMFWSTRKQSFWKTVRFKRDGKRRRKGIRDRRLLGYLKGIEDGDMALVCSQKSKGEGRRFLAYSRANICTNMDGSLTARKNTVSKAIRMNQTQDL